MAEDLASWSEAMWLIVLSSGTIWAAITLFQWSLRISLTVSGKSAQQVSTGGALMLDAHLRALECSDKWDLVAGFHRTKFGS